MKDADEILEGRVGDVIFWGSIITGALVGLIAGCQGAGVSGAIVDVAVGAIVGLIVALVIAFLLSSLRYGDCIFPPNFHRCKVARTAACAVRGSFLNEYAGLTSEEQNQRCGLIIDRVLSPSDPRTHI